MLNVQFGSDNHSGVHPDVLKKINESNKGYAISYGEDIYTNSAIKKFIEVFGDNIEVFFVSNGTAANIIGLRSVIDSYNSVICSDCSHLNVHECCGPERFIGCKLITAPTKDGKLSVELIKPYIVGIDDPHMAQPKVISITQSTELGTVYRTKEIKKIVDFAHNNNMLVHMDGARICNAAVFLDTSLKEMTNDIGVDILSFGGTKNGMMFGDSIVFLRKELSNMCKFFRKQGMNLTSKMRYISAQFNAFFSNDLWYNNAKHANDMAFFLYNEIKDIKNIRVTQNVESNAVFVQIPKKYLKIIQKKYFFHIFDEKNSIARLMCSFNTRREDISEFVDFIKKTMI